MLFATGWMFIIWLVFLANEYFELGWRYYGLRPREVSGLIGLITYPFLHGDWNHLIDNTTTGFVLLLGLYSFYGRVAWRVMFWSWFMSGVWMWVAARDGNHIGFSGVIYAMASFIFFSGLFRKYYRLMALSGAIVFLYGSMVWGVLPIQPRISWEGHLFGAIAGFILAIYFRAEGPQRPKYSWELEEEEDDDDDEDYQDPTLPPQDVNLAAPGVRYIYVKSEEKKAE